MVARATGPGNHCSGGTAAVAQSHKARGPRVTIRGCPSRAVTIRLDDPGVRVSDSESVGSGLVDILVA
jgi:hypothetical protein